MRIGIDARIILNPQKGEAIGAGHYTYQLIRHLLEIDKKNEYVLFFDFKVREKDVRKFTRENTTIRFYPFSDYKKYLPGAYNEILTAATLRKEKLDVLHSTSPMSRIPLSYRGKTVVTFHDMAIYKIPDCFSRAGRAKKKVSYSLMANKADKIIAVSDSIKKDVEEIFKSGSKTEVIYSGLDRRFFENPERGSERVLGKFGIKKKYIIFLGTIEPSKNITRLLNAFAIFKKNNIQKKTESGSRKDFDYQLILAGKRGWLAKEYLQIAKDLGLGKDVIFTGYVIGDELVPLLKGAEFFILPSLYEGFGMTVLEAFATGVPTIVSEAGSLKEVAGDASYFINPIDTEGIAEAMEKFSQDGSLRDIFRQKGFEQVKKFDWNKVAKETIEVYNQIVGADKK
ncbi:MAG: glycosyltransferase family 1 protein [Candidatus Moranbacteria bacterium]|jgi:glycosyltransferase involved in cell wall biosynthesis|nr:glycosyltransferase family 1 protein [Candidatus Moranbacteria bacterium]MDD5651854.1 glycosyltransferase family 1 protein [Candidatus Moranbacteria bacterium]MDX9855334.1 glycosyltransferase family 1 protein [Candidatus Moranbacteria bacterium]